MIKAKRADRRKAWLKARKGMARSRAFKPRDKQKLSWSEYRTKWQ